MIKTIAIVTIVALTAITVAGGAYWWATRVEDQPIATSTEESPQSPNPENISTKEDPQPTETTSLEAVGVYSGNGTASRTTVGKYIHGVKATLDDPAEGDFYEGWLVIPGGDFISTGKLTKESHQEWSLTYTSDTDRSKYTQVVITEETEKNGLDNTPEDHVLEGSF